MSASGNQLSHFEQLAYCAGKPGAYGLLRARPEDFQVRESLVFEPTGSGEHVYVQVRKRQLTTRQVAVRLARLAGVSQKAVGYAGMKDKHALAQQWFSVLPGAGAEPDWRQLEDGFVQVLAVTRHGKKLKRSAVRSNHFVITVRGLSGDTGELTQRFAGIKHAGVPNYFAAQRFGINDGNLQQARLMFGQRLNIRDRYRRGLYLSAARSLIFNQVLAYRVSQSSWNQILPGDVMVLDGRRSWFPADAADGDLPRRLHNGEIHPSGPMWGQGELASRDQVADLESAIAARENLLSEGLAGAGLKQERRPLRVLLQAPEIQFEKTTFTITFALPSGSYATSVMRELVCDPGRQNDVHHRRA